MPVGPLSRRAALAGAAAVAAGVGTLAVAAPAVAAVPAVSALSAEDLTKWRIVQQIFDETGVSAKRATKHATNQTVACEPDEQRDSKQRLDNVVAALSVEEQENLYSCLTLLVLADTIRDSLAVLNDQYGYAGDVMLRIGETFLGAAEAGAGG